MTSCHLSLEVELAAAIEPDLSDGHAMKSGVELTITATVEADPLVAARRSGDRGGAVAAGVAATRAEAGYVSGLGDQLGGGQSAAPLEFEQAGR